MTMTHASVEMLPLYKEIRAPGEQELPEQPRADCHVGLWNERFFAAYAQGWQGNSENVEGITAWWKKLDACTVGKKDTLEAMACRLRGMAQAQGGKVGVFRCAGPFVTGMGQPHPLENGFLWHPTLGTPYLPGSAIKGMVRALLTTALPHEDRKAVLQRWLGTTESGQADADSSSMACGQFIFLDALPVQPCKLHVEIMTPHMGKWYEQGEDPAKNTSPDVLPGDWHAPVPVRYLAATDVCLQFAVLPRAGTQTTEADIEDVWKVLARALSDLGAGAKTALGFGQFEYDEKEEKKVNDAFKVQQEQARKQHVSAHGTPLDQAELELAEWCDKTKCIPASERKTGNQKLGEIFDTLALLIGKLLSASEEETDEKRREQRHAWQAKIKEVFPEPKGISGKDQKKYRDLLKKLAT